MAASLPPGSDFLLSKTDAELLYLARNPAYYHPELVSTARQELQRRGVSLALPTQPELSPAAADFNIYNPSSFNISIFALQSTRKNTS